MMHCLIIGGKKSFVLVPLKVMLIFEVDILSIQKHDNEIDRTDLSDD